MIGIALLFIIIGASIIENKGLVMIGAFCFLIFGAMLLTDGVTMKTGENITVSEVSIPGVQDTDPTIILSNSTNTYNYDPISNTYTNTFAVILISLGLATAAVILVKAKF